MFFRFSLAALTVVAALTSCAKPPTISEQTDSYFKGPSQITVTHVITRADDGSDIFLTIDGNDAGALIAGQDIAVRVPAGKHLVGGYAATMLGLGRVTIAPLEVTTKAGEATQIAYSVTRQKPVFAKESVTKLPPPAPEPAQPAATATAADQSASATTAQPAATATAADQSASATTAQPAATATTADQSASATTAQPAATATTADQSATTTTAQPAATATTADQSASTTTAQPAATATTADQSASTTTAQPAATATTADQSATTTAHPAATTTSTSQSNGG